MLAQELSQERAEKPSKVKLKAVEEMSNGAVLVPRKYKKRRKGGKFLCDYCAYKGPTSDAKYQHFRSRHPEEYGKRYGKKIVGIKS